MPSTTIYYVVTYFEFPELNTIHSEPTYDTLQLIKDQIKVNTSSVTRNLGGGALGLVLTNGEYSNITATPYVYPVCPGPLTIPVLTVYHVANRIQEYHNGLICVFHEVTDVEKTITKQIIKAIDLIYIKMLRS